MKIVCILLWFFLPILFPGTYIASLSDVPLLALCIAEKKLSLARILSLLCLWNGQWADEASFATICLIRLLSVDVAAYIIRSLFVEVFPRACLASLLISSVSFLLFHLLLPTIAPALFRTSVEWSSKLLLFTLFLAPFMTSIPFALRFVFQQVILQKRRQEE